MWKYIIDAFISIFKILGRGERLERTLTNLDLRIMRLELLEAIRRKDTYTVCEIFTEYKKLGGNFYADALYNEYMSKQKGKNKC